MKLVKRLALVFGALVLLVVAAAVIVPFVVDVDKYRPLAVQAVNDKINGKFDLGKMSLSLWGQIRIAVDRVYLQDAQGRKILSVKNAYFHIPLSSLLAASPELILKVTEPEIQVVNDKHTKKMNVLSFDERGCLRPTPAPAPVASVPQSAKPSAGAGTAVDLPKAVLAARLGLEFTKAKLTYLDEVTAGKTELNEVNVSIRDISLSRPIQLEIGANVDAAIGATGRAKGPIKFKAVVETRFEQIELKHLNLKGIFDADGLVVDLPGLFSKTNSIPAHVSFDISQDGRTQQIAGIKAVFHNAEVAVTGSISELSTDIKVGSNAIDLSNWSILIPMLKEYQLSGGMSLHGETKGPAAQLAYSGKLEVKDLSAKAPNLKTPPIIQAKVEVSTDRIDSIQMKLQGPGSDLSVQGQMISFTQPKLNFQITSNQLDLDQWLILPEKPKAAAAGEAAPPGKAEPAQAAADLDKSVDPLSHKSDDGGNGGRDRREYEDDQSEQRKDSGLSPEDVDARPSGQTG